MHTISPLLLTNQSNESTIKYAVVVSIKNPMVKTEAASDTGAVCFAIVTAWKKAEEEEGKKKKVHSSSTSHLCNLETQLYLSEYKQFVLKNWRNLW
jgi:hypothetical protein